MMKTRDIAQGGVYRILAKDGKTSARRGELRLAHGSVQTPVFMPVGTQATVKTLSNEDLESLDYEIILANTYHLFLRPGIDLLESSGGLHTFMGWKRCILTDSGGYQIFSLAGRRHISEEGVTFVSHVDGARHLLTPENVTRAQRKMGVDIAMCLDECPPYPVTEAVARDMMERTLRWAARCRKAWDAVTHGNDGAEKNHWTVPASPRLGVPACYLFGIVQGATYPSLRRESAEKTVSMDFPGYAVGGLSVGEPREVLVEMLTASVSGLPEDRPRYLMGAGKPEDILVAVEQGIDMFDCVLPTRNGRNGQALTWRGPLNLWNARCREDSGPIDPSCACAACRGYSRRYIAHLFRAGEFLGLRLVSLHNLAFMINFMRQIQKSIECSEFLDFKARFLRDYSSENT